jgi:2-polyprenyl-6-hydroxyphenyl methylase / 3-demethylubiquinone-9 3-methyltransferase
MEKLPGHQAIINNEFYETLQDRWYTAHDHPIALLRAENVLRAKWMTEEIKKQKDAGVQILDVACGAGFLSNAFATSGFDVTGIDLSQNSLEVAKRYDRTKTVRYLYANAYELPFADQSFDVVCAMDILEHVEKPQRLIQEASRVLRKDGLFFFHTFNRNFLSYLIVIKGIDWFVKNVPPHMHVYHLFIKPNELSSICLKEQLPIRYLTGFVPCCWNKAFWKMLWTGEVHENYRFKFVNNLSIGYCGYAVKT